MFEALNLSILAVFKYIRGICWIIDNPRKEWPKLIFIYCCLKFIL